MGSERFKHLIFLLPFHGIMYRTQRSRVVGEARTWGETNAQMQFIMTGFG
jgi:hypothetical protein